MHSMLPNGNIRVNCLVCTRMGRYNLVQSPKGKYSNLWSHLKVKLTIISGVINGISNKIMYCSEFIQRMHPFEYAQHAEVKNPGMGQSISSHLPSTSQSDMDIQQSVVSTIKSECFSEAPSKLIFFASFRFFSFFQLSTFIFVFQFPICFPINPIYSQSLIFFLISHSRRKYGIC